MSATSATAHAHVQHAEHHELGFVRTYVFSTDHKMIARQFLFLGLFMMIIGGLLALVVRWQLAWPETAVPGLGVILTETGGILESSQYNMAFTMLYCDGSRNPPVDRKSTRLNSTHGYISYAVFCLERKYRPNASV